MISNNIFLIYFPGLEFFFVHGVVTESTIYDFGECLSILPDQEVSKRKEKKKHRGNIEAFPSLFTSE